jgi:putative nucleotidyltransferase with HDIG domain/PAS domain S-box-containing protein
MPDLITDKAIDIEQRTDLERRIKRAKHELEEMIDLNPQVILLIDKQGQIVRANKATLEFLGISDYSDILSKDLQSVLKAEDPNAVSLLFSKPEEYQRVRVETEVPNLGPRTLELSLVSSGRERDLSVLMISDVSDESEKAQNLEKQHKKEVLQALTGALMHNINQPLTVIMMRAQMMKFAIQRGQANSADVRRGLDDVMKLAMTVADMLQAVDKPNDFVTEPYVEGVEILDMQKSGSADVELDLTCSAMLNVLLTTLDKRESGTILHARRCGALTYAIAEIAGLDSRTCEIAREAGYVHDIGKLAIPDTITLKPSPLTDEEYATMRTHSETGYQIVRSLIFLEDEAEAVRTHHEFWDGSGYPQGLSGEHIPVAARVVACADAFEVMLSGRPYRPALALEDAVEEFAKFRGRQFDPVISDVVIENAQKLHDILLSVQ